MKKCYIRGCETNLLVEENKVTFHKLKTLNEEQYNAKLKNIALMNNQPDIYSHPPHAVICSKHYKEDCFLAGVHIRKLEADALPTIFNGNDGMQDIECVWIDSKNNLKTQKEDNKSRISTTCQNCTDKDYYEAEIERYQECNQILEDKLEAKITEINALQNKIMEMEKCNSLLLKQCHFIALLTGECDSEKARRQITIIRPYKRKTEFVTQYYKNKKKRK